MGEEKNKDKITKKKFGYRITVGDPLGESYREINTFGGNKVRDDKGVVMLSNEKEGFQETFPLDKDNDVTDDLIDVVTELRGLEKSKSKDKENKLNREQRIYTLKKKLKALILKSGSYLKIDKDGMPHILYVRYRSGFVPLKWNLDFSNIHTPPEYLQKNVLSSDAEKRVKYKQHAKDLLTWGLVLFFVINLVWTGILAYSNVKSFSAYDDSNIARLQNKIDSTPLICAEMYGKAGENFLIASENAVNITDTLRKDIAPKINNNVPVTNVR